MSGTMASVAPAMPTASPASMPAAGLPRLPDWAGQVGPSHGGGILLVVLMLVMAVGLARVLGRRLDPRARAEARVFDRAGLDPIQRRVLRRAARRLEPTVPVVSLLLSERLLVAASSPEACPRADLAVLEAIRRRRFGRGLRAVDGRPEAGRPRPTGALSDVATMPDAAPSAAAAAAAAAATAAARRQRAASLLAAAIEIRDRRGAGAPDADAAASGRPTPVAAGAGPATGR